MNDGESSQILVSLDRIEEEMGVLLAREGMMWIVPIEHLPENCREGDVLEITFRRDAEETEALANRVRDLQQRLLERTEECNAKEE